MIKIKKYISEHAKEALVFGLVVFVCIGYVSWYVWKWEHRPEVLEVHFFDLKKGNAVFVRTPHGKTMLFGGGESNEIVKKLTEVMPVYCRRIDEVFLWGSANNNIGVIDVLSRYGVGSIVVPAFTSASSSTSSSSIPSAPFSIIESAARDRVVRINHMTDENELDGVLVSILDTSSSTVMNAIRVSYGHTHFLLIGDTTKKEQADIAKRNGGDANRTEPIGGIRAQVLFLKSAIASRIDLSFYNEVNPKYIIVPKLPSRPKDESSKKAFNVYTRKDVRVFSLEKEGTAAFTSDGNFLEIRH